MYNIITEFLCQTRKKYVTAQKSNIKEGEKYLNNLEKAKKILSDGGYTCVLYNGRDTFCSTERGVAPLLKLYDEKKRLQ